MTVPDVVVVGVAVVVVVTVLILVLTVVVVGTMDMIVVGGVEVALSLHISPAYAPAAGVLPAFDVLHQHVLWPSLQLLEGLTQPKYLALG